MSKLDEICAKVNAEWKEDIAARGIKRVETDKIPFTSPKLNRMTYGGIPRGRIIEFAGDEGGGKTTTALDVCKNAQELFKEEYEVQLEKLSNNEKKRKYLESRGPKKIVYADCENTLDEDWAVKLGVDVNDMYILKPQTQSAEDIFQILLDMIETDEVGLVVIDSLGVMLSQQAYEKDMTEKTYGGIAMALTLFSKKAEFACTKYDCTLIGINQMRDNFNSTYGGKITTGGRAWKHNCSLRLMFSKGDYLDDKGNTMTRSSESPSGNRVMVSIVKTKTFKPDRLTGYYSLMYDNGIDIVMDLVDVAIKNSIIVQSGAWFTFVDPESGELLTDEEGKEIKLQGKPSVIKLLRENTVLCEELRDQLAEIE